MGEETSPSPFFPPPPAHSCLRQHLLFFLPGCCYQELLSLIWPEHPRSPKPFLSASHNAILHPLWARALGCFEKIYNINSAPAFCPLTSELCWFPLTTPTSPAPLVRSWGVSDRVGSAAVHHHGRETDCEQRPGVPDSVSGPRRAEGRGREGDHLSPCPTTPELLASAAFRDVAFPVSAAPLQQAKGLAPEAKAGLRAWLSDLPAQTLGGRLRADRV